MVKTSFLALTLTLVTMSGSFLANPAMAADNDALASITADRDNLRNRLSRAIAYSKQRGEKLAETEMQLARSVNERKVLSDRLRRVIALSKERGSNLNETETQLARSMNERKVLADRLRRAIAVSKERAKNITNLNASHQKSEHMLQLAVNVSKKTEKNRRETETQLSKSMSERKVLADRLRRVIALSKEKSKNLANSNASRKHTEDRLRRAIAHSKSTRINLEEQLKLSNENASASSDWVAQVGASLQARIGGLQGTEIIENFDDGTVKIQLGNNGLFQRAGTSLSANGRALLTEIAPQLNFQDASFTVIGHTDSTPVGQGGRYGSNEELSFARSMSALQFLREQGISKELLSAAGHGADSPIASNDTVEGRQKNRRVEIVLRSN